METLKAQKVDLKTARLAMVDVPPFEEPIDGLLPAERVAMVVAEGKGKFEGATMVEIGVLDRQTKTLRGFVYRQPVTYQGFRRGRDVFVDPADLSEGVVRLVPQKRGLWVRLEELGTLVEVSTSTP